MADHVVIFQDGFPYRFAVRDGTAEPTSMRRFCFNRVEDISGMSGTGIVVEGVEFSDGRVALRWVTGAAPSSTCIYDSINDAIAIHGHDGATQLVWIDDGR